MVCKLKKNTIQFDVLAQGETFIQNGNVYMKTSLVGEYKQLFNAVSLSDGLMVEFDDKCMVRRVNMECKEV